MCYRISSVRVKDIRTQSFMTYTRWTLKKNMIRSMSGCFYIFLNFVI